MKQSDKDQLLADISTRMPSVQSEADITPSVLYAYNMSKENLVDQQLDDAFTKRNMQEIDNTISDSYKERGLQIAAMNAATSRIRANQKKGSTSYILEPDREITPWIKKNMGGSGTIDIPKNLIEGYYGASRTTFNKGNIVKATLNKATGEVTVTTNDGQTQNYVNTYTPGGFIKVITSETPGTAKKSASDDDEDINIPEVPSIF
jgi:hypothetical protein